MSENEITPVTSESVPADFDDAFDGWIAGASIAKRSVQIYAKPGLYARYEELQRELEIAEAFEKDDETLGGSQVEEVVAKMKTLYDEWVASKSTWTVRALNDGDYKTIEADMSADGLVEPDELIEPKPLPEKHTDQQGKSHTEAVKKYTAALPAYQEVLTAHADATNLRVISRAVVGIKFADGRTKDSITLAQLETLRERLGERQLLSLIQASQIATYQEPEIPAGFSRRTSEDDQT